MGSAVSMEPAEVATEAAEVVSTAVPWVGASGARGAGVGMGRVMVAAATEGWMESEVKEAVREVPAPQRWN